MNKELISFIDVSIGYGTGALVNDLNFTIYENDFIGLVGPNGAGKTTMLKTILGSLKPLKGDIIKKDVKFGYVPQRDIIQPLLPYSVFDVVMMSRYSMLGIFKNPSQEDEKIVNQCLHHVGIYHLKDENYNNLSGGQRQRTLIARALAVEPNVLILDEPTNGMDTPSHYQLLNLIEQLHGEDKLTIILVSHLLTDVANIVKKLMLIERSHFQFGEIDSILSEDNLRKTYSTDFIVSKIENEFIITSGKKN